MRETDRRGNRTRTAAVTCALLTTVAGCGSVETKAGVPIESAATTIATTVCPKAWQCCTAAQLMGNDSAGSDEPSCETMTTQAYAQQLDSIDSSERKQRARYDGVALETCMANVRAASCESLNQTNHLRGVPGCQSFVQPLVSAGGACGPDFDCITGWCKHQPNSLDDGVCTALPNAGEPCPDHRCAGALACDPDSTTCVEVAPPAAACFYSSGCSVAGPGGLRSSAGLDLLAAAAAALAATRRRRRPSCRA